MSRRAGERFDAQWNQACGGEPFATLRATYDAVSTDVVGAVPQET